MTERERIVAYLRDMAAETRTRHLGMGMVGSAMVSTLITAASEIERGAHMDDDGLPRELVVQAGPARRLPD